MKKIKKKTLQEEIVVELRKMIMRGQLKEGEKINQSEICTALGISQAPLREALGVLSGEGLVSLVPNCGAWVKKPTFDEIREIFEILLLLEGYCARTAASVIENEDIKYLEELQITLQNKSNLNDIKGYNRYNEMFHEFIRVKSGNKNLLKIIVSLNQKTQIYRNKFLDSLPLRFERALSEHRKIVKAFHERDSEQAEIAVRTHLQNLQSHIVEVMMQDASQHTERRNESISESKEACVF